MRPDTPPVAVDIIIEMTDQPETPIVLIERKNPPKGWALPGGFVDPGETVGVAARREAQEETSLTVELAVLLGAYSDPKRDPRGQTVSLVFVGQARGRPVAADDAVAVSLADPFAPPLLAFDHARILRDYCHFRRHGKLPLPE